MVNVFHELQYSTQPQGTGAIDFHRIRFGTADNAEFVQDRVSLTRPIPSRQGLTGTLWIIFLHSLGMLSFTKPGEEVELSVHVLISSKVEAGWVFRKELLTTTPENCRSTLLPRAPSSWSQLCCCAF